MVNYMSRKKVEEVNNNNEEMNLDELGVEPSEYIEKKRWLFFGLPFTFTKYTIKHDVITIDSGFFKKIENDCYMYKVRDIKLEMSFWERLSKLGTVVCYTGDTTDPVLKIEHIKHCKAVKNFILKAAEEERIKRRTLNTMDIAHGDLVLGTDEIIY